MHLLKKLLFCFSLCATSSLAYANAEHELEKQRELFQQAKKALETNQLNLFEQYSHRLKDYPLSGYLQYLYLRHRLNQVSTTTIEQFLEKEKSTFYGQRLRQVWLQRLAQQKAWTQFLHFYQAPQNDEIECYRLQALLATGQQQTAFKATPDLWLVPRSQNKACDPVFERWEKAGFLTQDLRWQRLLLALRNNQFALARYLAKAVTQPPHATAWVDYWQQMHDNPLRMLNLLPAAAPTGTDNIALAKDRDLSKEIILHGIDRLARRSTEKAYQSWLNLQNHYQFSPQERADIRQIIGTRAALNREPESLTYFGSENGGEWHVRAALWQQNWPLVKKTILELPHEQQSDTKWQYWLARAEAAMGAQSDAQLTYSNLVPQRDYYGFMAADRLNTHYQMNHRPIEVTEAELKQFRQNPDIQRLYEFYVQNMLLEARREAYQLRQTRSPRELQLVAMLTHQWGWHNQTIALLGSAQYWDALDLRFPVLYDSEVIKAGKKHGLDPSWLLAIARQESAFNPTARSHAGAMGLMQLMPETGKLISKLINSPIKHVTELYNTDRNIELGSAYLRKMYDENQKNPAMATAAYNAGPHRVNNWLPQTQLPADIWVENIPYNETRRYVRAVMSYAAIFDSQRNQTITPLSERMPAVKPKLSE